MPIIKSAKKRVRVTARATERNRGTRNKLRVTYKSFVASIKGGKKTAETHAEAQRALDVAVKKGVMHKNKAARKKAQLARAMKNSGAKVEKSSKAKAPITKKTKPKTALAKKAAPKVVARKAPAKKKTAVKK
jgi:small subunit ribosomal protein S20